MTDSPTPPPAPAAAAPARPRPAPPWWTLGGVASLVVGWAVTPLTGVVDPHPATLALLAVAVVLVLVGRRREPGRLATVLRWVVLVPAGCLLGFTLLFLVVMTAAGMAG